MAASLSMFVATPPSIATVPPSLPSPSVPVSLCPSVPVCVCFRLSLCLRLRLCLSLCLCGCHCRAGSHPGCTDQEAVRGRHCADWRDVALRVADVPATWRPISRSAAAAECGLAFGRRGDAATCKLSGAGDGAAPVRLPR